MEDRVLLSKADLTALVTPTSIERGVASHSTSEAASERPRTRRSSVRTPPDPEEPDVARRRPAGGVKGGTATLKATLTSNGLPLAGADRPLPDQGALPSARR